MLGTTKTQILRISMQNKYSVLYRMHLGPLFTKLWDIRLEALKLGVKSSYGIALKFDRCLGSNAVEMTPFQRDKTTLNPYVAALRFDGKTFLWLG